MNIGPAPAPRPRPRRTRPQSIKADTGLEALSAQQREALRRFRGLGAQLPPMPPGCLHELVEQQAQRTPQAPALRCGREVLRFRELDERANQLAHLLLANGLTVEDRVGVCLDRGPDLIIALLAVLKAGGCYLPLDPVYPTDRVSTMLHDSGARLVITRPEFANRCAGSAVDFLDPRQALLAEQPVTRPQTAVTADRLAYLIYTSGSTGRPKGAAIEHRSAVSFMHWIRDTFSESELSGVLAGSSICFDMSIFEIFGPLCWGGQFILVRDVLDLADMDIDAGVRLIHTVPSALSELIAAGAVPDSVQTVCLAGEPFTQALSERIATLPGVRRVLNLYGLSEDTTYTTCAQVRPGDVPTIGRPLPYTRTYILDAERRPLPAGAAGELYISGHGLARGYLNRPEETAARFLTDVFDPHPGRRMYRTGDRVRFRDDGQLEFLGRMDDQVKVRGFRIELGEVTAALVGCPGVRDAVASVLPGPGGEARLVGHLVAEEGAVEASTEVLARLRRQLPAHFVPSALVWLDRLPALPNGKVDRSALPAPDWADQATAERGGTAPDDGDGSTRPLDDVEAAIAAVWREVLGVHRFGMDDDFFTLGGDSLLATRCAVRLRASLRAAIAPATIFEHPTVRGLSDWVRQAPLLADDAARPAAHRNRAPLSFAQRQMWFLQQLDAHDTSYLVSAFVWIRGPSEAALVEQALGDVVSRHEALRTVFVLDGSEPAQVIRPDARVSMLHSDPVDGAAQLRRLAAQDAAEPMDLAEGPLLRARLVTLTNENLGPAGPEPISVLVLTAHHIIFDDWSLGVLVRDLARCYQARATAAAPPPPPAAGPAQFATEQRRWIDSTEGQAALDRLARSLTGAPYVLDLPGTRTRPPVRSSTAVTLTRYLDHELAGELRELARRWRASLYMVGLAAFGVLLTGWTRRSDLLVGSAFAGRGTVAAEEAIGSFVNTVALRLRPEPHLPFAAVLRAATQEALFGAGHQDVPFDRVVDRLRPPRSLAHNPLVQVAFGVRNSALANHRAGPVSFEGVVAEPQHARLDLTLWLDDRRDGLQALWTAAAQLLPESALEDLHTRYTTVLRRICVDPYQTVEDLVSGHSDIAASLDPGGVRG